MDSQTPAKHKAKRQSKAEKREAEYAALHERFAPEETPEETPDEYAERLAREQEAEIARAYAASPELTLPKPTPEEIEKAQHEAAKKARAKFGVREAEVREWLLEPHLQIRGVTQVVADARDLPTVSSWMAGLAAKLDGPIVLATKSPAAFASKFIACGGKRDALKIITALDFTDPEFKANFNALLDGWEGVPQLFAFPNLGEFVTKANSSAYSEKVLAFVRRYLWEGAAVFGWPSSQRKQAAGCAVWTNAGDVNLTLEDIRTTDEDTRGAGEGNKHEFAVGFIAGALAEGPKPLKEILAQASGFGIKERTLYRAGRDIVSSQRSSEAFGAATWELRRDRVNTVFCQRSSHLGAGKDD
jgi:hypothetical protein